MSGEQIKPGYKRTEVGVIPEEWEVRPFLNAVRIANGQVDPRVEPYCSMTLVAPDHIESRTGRLLEKRTAKEQKAISGKYVFDVGDIVYSKIRPYLRKAIVADSSGLCSADMYPLKPMADVVSGYVFSIILGERFSAYAESVSARSGMPKINRAELSDFNIQVPTFAEQYAIATVLSDVDALLAKLDQLIVKKRDIKQAAMQQLLTGQTRLPGFSEKWEETTFDQVVRHHSGNSSLIKGKLPDTHAFDLFPAFSASGQDVWCNHHENEGDALVVSAVGSRCGKAFLASGKWTAIANTHVVWPREKKINLHFLGFFVNDEDFWLKSGSGQPFVLFRQTFARKLRLPGLLEQEAIANSISDLCAELATLEARRDKTFALKQAMMQELLTGRVRLI